MNTLTKDEAEGLIELINRLDSISLRIHSDDVAHIYLIGHPSDVLALDSYLTKKLDPYLSKR